MQAIARSLPDTDNLKTDKVVQAPPAVAHFARAASLVAVSLACLPLSSSILALSYGCNVLLPQNGLRRKVRSSPRFRPKTILVTGAGTAKGLRIARAFYETGHRVIGADFQPFGVPSAARFSNAVSAYYPLRRPNASSGATLYMRDLIRIVEEENVQLWVSCSDLVSPVDDGQARKLLAHRTSCRTLQLDVEMASMVDNSDDFLRFAKSVGLPTPEVYAVQSRAAVHRILSAAGGSKQYVMRPVRKNRSSGVHDSTMLPRRTLSQTYQTVSSIKVTQDEPWILRQYVTGQEYHTCSIVIDSEVKAFVASPAPKTTLNYQALPMGTGIANAMLNFTQAFVAKAQSSYTGHLCFTFRVQEQATESGIQQKILPVACSPQITTAVVLFARTRGSIDLVRAYMNAFAPSADAINGYSGLTHPDYSPGEISFPHRTAPGVYFSGQDLVLLVLLPLLQLLTFRMGLRQFLHHCVTFLNHVVFWREATYELWDPLPWFWLYHVYVPMQLLSCMWTGRKWTGVDVSTTEILHDRA